MMKRFFVTIVSTFVLALPSFAGGYFSMPSTESAAYTDNYINSTLGELSVFIVNSTSEESTLTFTDEYVDSLYNCSWYSFKSSADELKPISKNIETVASVSTLSKFKLDNGYAVEYQDKEGKSYKSYIWLTKNLPISEVTWKKDSSYCDRLPLFIKPVMKYTPLVGIPTVIKRKLDVKSANFEMKGDELISTQELNLNGDSVLFVSPVPTVNTSFEISDALFDDVYVTDSFYTTAVVCYPRLSTVKRDTNEIDGEVVKQYFNESSGSFRSSAPLLIDFTSNMSPAVTSFEWQFANDNTFAGAISYSQASLRDIPEKLFEKAGEYWVRLIVRNDKGDCSYEAVTNFKIDGSQLYIPNAFTPNSGDETNQKFYVSFKSIAEYDCRIYTQWGRKVFDSQDITEGWDGTYNGDKLPTGVYFYIIKARGVDGKEYNKKGTVNLLRDAK